MAQLSKNYDTVNLGQGFPERNPDSRLTALVEDEMRSDKHQYAPMPGLPHLRSVIADQLKQRYKADLSMADITICTGATQGLYTAIAATVHAGDEVIIIEPAYDSYAPSVRSCGGKVVPVALQGHDFSMDWDALRLAVTSRTRMIVMNSPHNPTGKILYTTAFFNKLREIVSGTDIILLSDEVYELMTYGDSKHLSVLSDPELSARAYVVYSYGKSLHCTGWKMGYVVAPPPLMHEFHKLHQFIVFSVNHPLQRAIARYLESDFEDMSVADSFARKRSLLSDSLSSARCTWMGSEGSYFGVLDYSAVSDLDDVAFAKLLVREHGVTTIPLSPFYTKGSTYKHLRLCYAKSDETIKAGAAIISAL